MDQVVASNDVRIEIPMVRDQNGSTIPTSVNLCWQNISIIAKKPILERIKEVRIDKSERKEPKKILKNVCGIVKSGTLLALMGAR
jgi:hypothetical protein